jgi:hypothetical protein
MANTEAGNPAPHYLPRQRYVYSHGWAMMNARVGVTNDQGFTNSPDFEGRANVLVVGDSFIEALMLDYRDTLQARLNAALGRVYAAACSGNQLADSLQLVRFYAPRLKPRVIVVFVRPEEVAGLLDAPARGFAGFVVADGKATLVHADYAESKLKETVKRSALARYLYYNLGVSDLLRRASRLTADIAEGRAVRAQEKRIALGYYLSQLASLADAQAARVLLLVDGDRKSLYAPRKAGAPELAADRELLLELARDYGLDIVDMQPAFAQHWALHHERMDFSPADSHWNAVAHKLAADRLLRRIAGGELRAGAGPEKAALYRTP